jgi:hypothetical protein
MPSVPKTDNLRTIDAVYRTAGGLRALIELDAGRPLQFIHDVSPSAEHLASVQLMFSTQLLTTVGSTAEFASSTPASIFGVGGPAFVNAGRNLSNSWWWLMDAQAWLPNPDLANFDLASIAVEGQSEGDPSGAAPAEMGVKFYDQVLDWAWEASGLLMLQQATATANYPELAGLPRRFGVIRHAAQDAGAARITVTFRHHLLITPIGVYPPAIGFR